MTHLVYCDHWSACGIVLSSISGTVDLKKVTCKRCRRTGYYHEEYRRQALASAMMNVVDFAFVTGRSPRSWSTVTPEVTARINSALQSILG